MMPSSQPEQKLEVYSQTDLDKQPILFLAQTISEDKSWSCFILVVVILGASMLLLGVCSSLLGLTSIGIVGVAGGSITSAVMLVLRAAGDNLQRKKVIFDMLTVQSRTNAGLRLAKKLPDEAQERVYEKYIEGTSYRLSNDRDVLRLPEGRQSDKNISQSPPKPENDTNT